MFFLRHTVHVETTTDTVWHWHMTCHKLERKRKSIQQKRTPTWASFRMGQL